MHLVKILSFISLFCTALPIFGQDRNIKLVVPPASLAAEVYFVNLEDGDRVRSPFRIIFGLTRLGIAPADVDLPGTGHHHLLINTPLPRDLTQPIPFSDNYRHFGKGQSEAVISLPRGKHTLQLVFADAKHRPFIATTSGEKVVVFSKRITIEVVE